ncbi:hypothetical protein [Chitinophaga sp. MM2321]|uniref:hypothetical protein n=1 Tax=Chitinophaga sp. MM2321 TaxID=3137178 RepID=UPI0032D59725
MKYQQFDTPTKWVFYYILSSVIFAAGSAILAEIFRNNMWFFSVMHFVQFVILSVFYYLCINNPKIKTVIKIMPAIILIVFALDFFKIEGIRSYNSISAGIKSIIILAYGAIFFLQLLADKALIERAIYINSLPVFWYNAGLFLYFCSTFLFSLSYNLIQGSGIGNLEMTLTLISINYIVGIISMILLYIGLSKIKRFGYADN